MNVILVLTKQLWIFGPSTAFIEEAQNWPRFKYGIYHIMKLTGDGFNKRTSWFVYTRMIVRKRGILNRRNSKQNRAAA